MAATELETREDGGPRGRTTIADGVVAKIVGMATHEVDGVYTTGAGARHTLAEFGLGDEHAQGVSVEVGQREAAADIEAVLEYGANVRATTQRVRDHVTERVETLTGLSVVEVNVVVIDTHDPADEVEEPRARTDKPREQQPEAIRKLQRRRQAYQRRGIIYRTIWVIAGFTAVIAGLLMLIFPGPAFIVIPLGLAMLSFQFAWAQRALDVGVSRGMALSQRVEQASGREKLYGAIAIGLALLAVLTFFIVVL
jgi:uncharacterized protein (TIGR02611 family)